jgi:hypothetical protein
MSAHRVGTCEEWLAARVALLEEEKELTRRSDELARRRRELPWVPVEKEYRFDTEDGTKTLAELFDGRPELIVYHFMFGPNEPKGCPGCTFAADHFGGAVYYLAQAGVTFLCASRAPSRHPRLQGAPRLDVPVGLLGGQRLQPRLRRLHRGTARGRDGLQLRHTQARGRARPAQDRAHGAQLLRPP